MLICGDVIRPGLAWMLTRTHQYLAIVMAETRDPAGFARLRELAEAGPASSLDDALHYIGSVPTSDCPDLTALPAFAHVVVALPATPDLDPSRHRGRQVRRGWNGAPQ